MGEKKYYWLKLKDDFFGQKEIKKLRKIAGGDTYTVIYLKLQLLSLKNNGTLLFENIEDTFCEELALDIDEESENIKFTLMFLQKYGLLEEVNNTEFLLPKTMESIGSEGQCAERVRKHREKKKMLPSNTPVTAIVTCNGERERELDLEIQTDIHIQIDKDISFDEFWQQYPNKKAKKDAVKAWDKLKLTSALVNSIMGSLAKHKMSVDWVKDGGKFIPHPATWLNGERWNDEVEEAQTDLFGNKKSNKPISQMDMINNVLRGCEGGSEQDDQDTSTIDISIS